MASPEAFPGGHHCFYSEADDHGATHRSFRRCKKKQGHEKFMTIGEFQQKGPANFLPDKDHLALVSNVIKNTVRIQLSCTSEHRPNTYLHSNVPYPLREIRGSRYYIRYGTGFLLKHLEKEWVYLKERCACLHCKRTQGRAPESEPQFSEYFVIFTAAHVLFDSLEAESAEIEFFYDSEDRSEVKSIFGVCVLYDERKRLETDLNRVLCVTHDPELAEKLKEVVQEGSGIQITDQNPPPPFLVSHPHGVSKRISFGEFTGVKVFMVNEHASTITLKKGLKVRISGKLENEDVIERLNLKPNEENMDADNNNNNGSGNENCSTNEQTYTMLSDITICSPLPVTLHYDGDTNPKDAWWTLPLGLELITDAGARVTLPYKADNIEESIQLKIYIEGYLYETQFLCYNDDIVSPGVRCYWRRYRRYNYNMGACPGSSGAMIRFQYRAGNLYGYAAAHFGRLGEMNSTGLTLF